MTGRADLAPIYFAGLPVRSGAGLSLLRAKLRIHSLTASGGRWRSISAPSPGKAAAAGAGSSRLNIVDRKFCPSSRPYQWLWRTAKLLGEHRRTPQLVANTKSLVPVGNSRQRILISTPGI